MFFCAYLSLQLVQAGGYATLQGAQLHVASYEDAFFTQFQFDGLVRQFGVVVVFAEVAQPDVLQVGGHVVCQEIGGDFVAQVAVGTGYARFQMGRVVAHLQHFFVVVGLDDEVVGGADVVCHKGGNLAQVGDEAEHFAADADAIAYVVGAVVRHFKGFHGEVANLYGLLFLQEAGGGANLLRHAIAAVHAGMDGFGGIDGYV